MSYSQREASDTVSKGKKEEKKKSNSEQQNITYMLEQYAIKVQKGNQLYHLKQLIYNQLEQVYQLER